MRGGPAAVAHRPRQASNGERQGGDSERQVPLHDTEHDDGHHSETDAPHRTRFILIPMVTTAVGGLLANVLFGALFAPVGYMVCGWGDAVGEPVGTRWGKHRYKVPSLFGLAATRSLEGSTAVAIAGSLAAALALLVAGFSLPVAVGTALACGLLGSAVEAISHHGMDNLTIQLAGAGVARLLLG